MFESIDIEERIKIIINGLSDFDNDVKESCKEYLINAICTRGIQEPQSIRAEGATLFTKNKRVYSINQLIPLNEVLKSMSI
jgi:hypothetical protein